MTNEQVFRIIGQLDDAVLERYHEIDARLARKQVAKKRGLRAVAVAACAAILVGVLVPAAAYCHPIGRAILRRDSEALTELLIEFDGFAPWQERTAEKLESILPPNVWEKLQTTPILDVLTQSQYPIYAFKGAEYGAYLQEPVHLIYEVSDPEGRLNLAPQIDVRAEKYQDDTAAPKFNMETESETYQLRYAYSLGVTLTHQAVHVYQMHGSKGTYIAFLDAESGECIYWETPERAEVAPEGGVSEDSMIGIAYAMLRERVRDPEAYTLTERIYQEDGTYVCEYTRLFHSLHTARPGVIEVMEMTPKTCDKLSVTFDRAGNVIGYDAGYLGALRNADPEIPEELFAAAMDYENTLKQDQSGASSGALCIVITKDGRLAVARDMRYELGKNREYAAGVKYLTYLTEADPEKEGYAIISDGTLAGKRVQLSVNYYSPGSTSENNLFTYAYDERGNMISEIQYLDGEESSRRSYTYDEQNRLVKEEFVYNGTISQGFYWLYEYDLAGLLISKTTYNLQGKRTAEVTYDYDTQGRWICQRSASSVITRAYDENGSFVEIERGATDSKVWSHRELIYDKNGNLTGELSYKDGEVYSEYVHRYNKDGKEIESQAYVDGALVSAWTYEYRDGKLYRSVVYDGSDKITGIETYEYNEFGECILADYRDARGKIKQTTTYEYGTVEN